MDFHVRFASEEARKAGASVQESTLLRHGEVAKTDGLDSEIAVIETAKVFARQFVVPYGENG